MTLASSETKLQIKRCAVCKIDLKGRFVFVDEQIEAIFGQSLEELFGKNISSYLDSQGQRLVKDLLLKYNKYETSYDSCQVNLLSQDGTVIPANLIFSLCFAAGNPVNYQILIDPVSVTADPNSGTMDLLQALAELDNPDNITRLLPALTQFIGEPQIALYKLGRDNLTRLPSDINATVVIDEPTDLHLELALTGGVYSPNDQEAVRNAIELTGQAPAEYACAFLTSNNCFLLRVVLDEKLADHDMNKVLARIQQASKLIGRTLEVSSVKGVTPSQAIANDDLVESSLYAAELIEAAAMIINEAGSVIQYNMIASQMFGVDLKHSTLGLLLTNNMKMVDRDERSKLELYIDQAFTAIDLPRFETAVLLDGNRLASLSAMRSDPSDPKSNLLIIIKPVPKAADTKSARRIAEMVQLSFNDIKSLCRIANDYSAQLSHEYFARLDGEGDFVLRCLSSCLDKALQAITNYNELLKVSTGERSVSTIDLNVLMNDLAGVIKEHSKRVEVSISHNDLPKIKSDIGLLKGLLSILLSVLLQEWNEKEIKIAIDTITDDNKSILILQLPSQCPKQAIDRLQSISKVSLGISRDDDTDLSLTRLTVDHLLCSLDASLEIDAQTPMIKITLAQPSGTNSLT